jgi:hypothetical protein
MFKKNLSAILLSSAVGSSGCNQNPEYHFKGKIGEDQVRFYEGSIFGENNLEVIKPDGTIIRFYDCRNFRVDIITIISGDNTTRYDSFTSDEALKKVIADGQKQFDSYLRRIIEIQTRSLRE